MQLIYSLLPALVAAAAVDERANEFPWPRPACAAGSTLQGGACMPVKKRADEFPRPLPKCADGYTLQGAACVPVGKRADEFPHTWIGCAEGLKLQDGSCVPDDTNQKRETYCGVGMVMTFSGRCLPSSTYAVEKREPVDISPGAADFLTSHCGVGMVMGPSGYCVGAPSPYAVEKREDICGLEMVWDGTHCRVPVGKREVDVCGTEMIWDGFACRVPVGKRQVTGPCGPAEIMAKTGKCIPALGELNTREAEDQEEERRSVIAMGPCPSGLIRGADNLCVPVESILPKREVEDEQEKRQIIGCPPGQTSWNGVCVPFAAIVGHGGSGTSPVLTEKRQFGCPPGLVNYNGACFPSGAANSATTGMNKRQTYFRCSDEGTLLASGLCIEPLSPGKRKVTRALPLPCPLGTVYKNGQCVNFSLGALPKEKRSACGSNSAFVEGQGCVARSAKQSKRRSQ